MAREAGKDLAGRTGAFAAYSLALTLGSLPILRAVVELSRSDSSASHLVLIPFVTIALIYQDRKRIFSSARFGWGAGLGTIAVGVAGLVLTLQAHAPHADAASLTAYVAALVALWIGGFLFFVIPIPPQVLTAVTQILKVGSTEMVAGLFTLTGMPYYRDGFVFALPAVVIEVADECSGIRSSIALKLTALVAGHMYLHGRWRKVLLVLAVLPITVFKNGVRIVGLSWLATYLDPAFLDGRLHNDGGVLFFLLALGLLAPVLWLLRRSQAPETRTVHQAAAAA
jgi:exosortase